MSLALELGGFLSFRFVETTHLLPGEQAQQALALDWTAAYEFFLGGSR